MISNDEDQHALTGKLWDPQAEMSPAAAAMATVKQGTFSTLVGALWDDPGADVISNTAPPNTFEVSDGDAPLYVVNLPLPAAPDAAAFGPSAVSFNGGLGDDTITGSTGHDLIYGNQNADRLVGADGDDTVFGGRGEDHIFGVLGTDVIYGNQESDSLDGGWGDDSLYGGQGNDLIYGQEGHDRIDGNRGDDTLYGNAGQDLFVVSAGQDQAMDFVAGDDQIWLAAATEIATQTVIDGDLILNFNSGRNMTVTGVTEPLDVSSFNGVALQTVIDGNVRIQDADGDLLLLIGVQSPLAFESFLFA